MTAGGRSESDTWTGFMRQSACSSGVWPGGSGLEREESDPYEAREVSTCQWTFPLLQPLCSICKCESALELLSASLSACMRERTGGWLLLLVSCIPPVFSGNSNHHHTTLALVHVHIGECVLHALEMYRLHTDER